MDIRSKLPMKVSFLLVLGALTVACAARHAPQPAPTNSPPQLRLPRLASPDASLSKTVAIRIAPGGAPLITLRTPPSWSYEFDTGEDTRRHVVAGNGARVMLEFWTNQPTWACGNAACGLAAIDVNGIRSRLLRTGDGRSLLLFIPRPAEMGRRGVKVIATCETIEACQLAEKVVSTIGLQ